MLPRLVVWLFSVGIMILTSSLVCSQDYPNRPIRIVTTGVGASGDIISRLIAPGISGLLGQPVIVDNRPAGFIPGQVVSQASPDGHTLLVTGTALWIGPLIQSAPYDPVTDFSPVTLMIRVPNILVVSSSLPANSVKELIALAKSKPGGLNYTSGGSGGSSHLAAELFKAMAGINIVRIIYRNAATEMADLMEGQVQLTFGSGGTVMPHVKSGKLRALAVTTLRPSAIFPGYPTMADSGLPGYESASAHAVFTPPKTRTAVIQRLNQEIARTLNRAEIKEKVFATGGEVVGSSPEEFAALIKAEMARMGKVIKDAGIRAE